MKALEQAEWIQRQDPGNATASFDLAMALAPARRPPTRPATCGRLPPSSKASPAAQLETSNPARSQLFLIEFYGSLAERQRQAGRLDLARDAWRDAEAAFERATVDDARQLHAAAAADSGAREPGATLVRSGDAPAHWPWPGAW